MLLVLSIVALLNVVLLTVTCCMLYFLMKKRVQAASTAHCSRSVDAEKGHTTLVPAEQCSGTHLAQSTHSSGSLNSAELLNLPHNLCPTPKRTPFGGTRKPISLNETFASSMSSLSHSLSGIAILNAQLEALKNQRNLNETFTSSSRSSLGLNLEDLVNQCTMSEQTEGDDDSGYGSSGQSSEAASSLGQALDEVLNLYNNLEALKYAQQKQSRPRSTKSLSLPRLTHTPARHPSSTGIILNPYCLDMEF